MNGCKKRQMAASIYHFVGKEDVLRGGLHDELTERGAHDVRSTQLESKFVAKLSEQEYGNIFPS